jgi:sigma-B regulation protein RsbU (phosphoserine phosphatase)
VRTAATAAGGALGPARLLAVVNQAIRANIEKIGLHQYMTVCALRIDAGGVVTHAGLHLDLLVWRAARGEVERIATHGVWLGLVDDIREHLPESQLTLAPGDLLLLYTDGLSEVQVGETMFGADGVAGLFGEVARALPDGKGSAREVVDALLARMPAQRFDDDVTVVVLRRPG